jgi:hypothetical protein
MVLTGPAFPLHRPAGQVWLWSVSTRGQPSLFQLPDSLLLSFASRLRCVMQFAKNNLPRTGRERTQLSRPVNAARKHAFGVGGHSL